MNGEDQRDLLTVLATLAFIGLIALLLSGCSLVREEVKKETQVEQTVTRTGPLVADTPVGQVVLHPATVTVDRRQTTDTRTDETRRAEPPDLSAAAPLVSGVASLVPGVGGLLAAGIALWSRQRMAGALKATVQGVEEWKEKATPNEQKDLLTTLSKRMDASHKTIVSKLKT